MLAKLKLIAILTCFLITLVSSQTNEANYCRLCRNHIACLSKNELGAACGVDGAIIQLSDVYKNLLLYLHNGLRSYVASGKLEPFPPAQRMATVQWDNELAKLAEINARNCVFQHDRCRNTDRFPWAGQNIARFSEANKYPIIGLSIYKMLFIWFNEYRETTIAAINSYRRPTNGSRIGHFTGLMQEKQTHMGCAAVNYRSNDNLYNIYWVCNYAMTNIINRPVYVSGPPCSRCESGCNPQYEGLCNVNEHIVPV